MHAHTHGHTPNLQHLLQLSLAYSSTCRPWDHPKRLKWNLVTSPTSGTGLVGGSEPGLAAVGQDYNKPQFPLVKRTEHTGQGWYTAANITHRLQPIDV